MLTNNEITHLETYSYKKISKSNSAKIEQKILKNSIYNKEASVYLDLFSGFKALELEAVWNNINRWEIKYMKSIKKPQQKIYPINKMLKYAAAAILILSFIPLGYLLMNKEMNSEKIFEANFSPILTQNYYTSRSKTVDNKTNLSKGISAYILEDYSEAIKYLNLYIDNNNYGDFDNNSNNIELYLGISYLAENHLKEAKNIFEKISKKGTETRQQHTEWYLTLSHVKENNIQKAKEQLKSITSQKLHIHFDNAIQLEKQIEVLKINKN